MNVTRLAFCGAIFVWLQCLAIPGSAYELHTHREMTTRAFNQTANITFFLDAVGINARDTFDSVHAASPGELDRFKNTGTPHDWMIEGAIREDDFMKNAVLEALGCPRSLNPPSQIDRFLHHFFDVQRQGGGLTPCPPGRACYPTPDWALGLQGRGEDEQHNHFTLLDARAYQVKALLEPTWNERERNTALLFRALGHVVHLLLDMAQPQHTRNDRHAGCLDVLAGEESVYESYTNTRVQGGVFRGRPASPLVFSGYTSPALGAPRDFWTNAQGQGLADFSSRNFFSAGTNLSLFGNCGGLSAPPCSPDQYTQRDVPFSLQTIDGQTVTGQVRQYLRTLQDPNTGPIPDVPVSSRSVWDQHLEQRGFFRVYSLNTLNYDAMSDILLPRAVGYSAGLLDYFFRGRIEIAAPDRFVYARAPFTADNSGAFTSLRFKVRNATPNEAAGAGTLQAVVRYRTAEGNLFVNPLAPLSATPVVALSAVQNVTLTDTFQELTFDFQAHPIPTNAADLFLTVVYQGPLGSEPNAVAVGGKDIREPDPVVIVEATDYDCYQGQPYLVAGLPVSARDLTGDGVQDLFGPYREQGVRVKLDPAGTWLNPSAERFDLTVSELMGGQYTGFVVLQDQYSYQVAWQSIFQDTSTGQSEPYTRWYDLAAIYNSVSTDPDGTVRRQVTYANPAHFRGLTVLHGVATTTFATSHACYQQMFTLSPAVTAVPATLSTQ